MIAAALKGLKERGGSSRQAILKYIVANYKVDAAKAAVPLRMALKRAVAAGSIAKAKESGKGAGKYKLGKVEKPKKAKKAKKPKKPKAKKAKKPAAKKAKKPAKKAAKKPAAKKPAKKAAKPKKAAKKAAPKKK
jgi:outer membrane biosynthesis protein TonB